MSRDAQMADASSAADPTPMEPLLRLVNKLQEACALAGDVADSDASGKASKLPSLWETLPQIVVVGGQSSGKSSVLEAIVGRDFLPRGAGICTRRPLVLHLHGAPASEVASARFLHKPKTVFSDFNEVRLEIERETDRSLQSKGHKKAVSAEPIMLSIRAAGAPSLTLVDMPGLTKVATADQPASTVADIETMAKKFIVSKNVVIVAVSAANADIATSDGVRVAKEVDPNSERTLGVLTKLDLMDKGTDATEVLSGKAVHLGIGWCAVVNRSQSDIASGVDMSTARTNERAWFEAHKEVYATETDDFDSSNDNLQATTEYTRRGHKKSNLGTDALVSALVNILGEQVRRKIPKIRDTVETSANALEMELARLGPATPHFEDRGALVHEVLRGCDAYERDFADELDKGTGERDSGGGEAIRALFESALLKNLNAVNLEAFYDPKRVRKVVDASDGFQPHLVAPEMGIRRLIELGLETLHEPVERCVAQVDAVLQSTMREALRRHAGEAEKTSFLAAICAAPRENHSHRELGSFRTSTSTFASSPLRRYPRLREAVVAAAADALHRLRRDAHAMTSAMVDMEAAYFDAEFFRKEKARAERARDGDDDSTRTAKFATSSPNAEPSDYSDSSSRLKTIASSVRLYVEAVRDRLAKTVPKAIVFRQVAVARRGVLATFADRVGGVDDAELRAWMEEDPAVSRRRALCRERLELLDKARKEIQVAMGER